MHRCKDGDGLKYLHMGIVLLLMGAASHGMPWSNSDVLESELAYLYSESPLETQDVTLLSADKWSTVDRFGSHGFKPGEFWLRIKLRNMLNNDLHKMMRLNYALHDYVDIYQITPQKQIINEWHLGDMVLNSERPIKEKLAAFPVRLSAHESLDIYIRIKGFNAMNLDTDIISVEDHDYSLQISILLAGLVYGILLVMAIYNFGIALFTGDKAYYVYVTYVVSFTFFALALTGDGYYYLWVNSPNFNAYSIPLSAGLMIIPSLSFLYYLLAVKSNAPKTVPYFRFLGVMAVIFIISIAIFPVPISLKLINIFSILASFFILGVGMYLFIKEVPIALIYVVAWVIPLVGFAVLSMSALGVIASNAFTQNASIYGGVIETIILSLALAYRIKLERSKKEMAMENALQSEEQDVTDRLMYQEIFDHAPVGIFRYTMNGELVAVNPVLARMVGFSSVEEMLNEKEKTREMFSENSDLWKEIVTQKEIIDREVMLTTAKKVDRAFSVSMHAHENKHGGTIEGYLTDITERKEAQHRHEVMERERMSSMEQLVTGVAHEINTPLGTNVTSLSYLTNLMEAIQGKMEAGTLTVKDFKSFLEDGNHAVNIMSQNFTTMTGLVSRFKLVSVKQMNIEKANMHMAEYFNELIESYKEQYPDVLIQVNTHGIKEVESYPAAWTIIIDQLVENSVAHGFSTEQSKK